MGQKYENGQKLPKMNKKMAKSELSGHFFDQKSKFKKTLLGFFAGTPRDAPCQIWANLDENPRTR